MKKYNKNWLFYSGLVSILIFIIFLFIYPDATNSRFESNEHLFVLILFGCLIMPVLEEIIYRGMFQKKLKKGKFLFYVSLFVVFNVFVFFDSFSFIASIGVLLITAILVYLVLKLKTDLYLSLFMVFNAFWFGLVHYKIADFYSLSSAYMILIQFGMGLLLIWITYNFSLLKAMLIHIVYNTFFILLMVVGLFSINEETMRYEDEFIIIEVVETPNFSSNAMTTVWLEKGDSLAIKNTSLTNIVEFTLFSDLRQVKPLVKNPYQKYNVNARFKKRDSSSLPTDILLHGLQKLELVESTNK